MPLTEKEIKVFEQSGDLWNSFLELPTEHPNDINEFRFHIHALQNILLSRSAYREINGSDKLPKEEIIKELKKIAERVFNDSRVKLESGEYKYQDFFDYSII